MTDDCRGWPGFVPDMSGVKPDLQQAKKINDAGSI
jgi:hypothetical protein